MDKSKIKAKVKQAYKKAKQYPDFLYRFKHEIQELIDSFVPSEVTHPWHVQKDLDHLSKLSKTRGYKVDGFLMLVVNYVDMIIKAVEEGRETINFDGQYDMFDVEEPDNKEEE